MSNQPVEISENAIRIVIQIIIFGIIAYFTMSYAWPSIQWGLDRFPRSGVPEGGTLLIHFFVGLIGASLAMRAIAMFFFNLLPYMLARLFRKKPPQIPRR